MLTHPSIAMPQAPKPVESARYTGEMLDSLRKLAVGHQQILLAHLLDLAAHEAKMLTRDHQN